MLGVAGGVVRLLAIGRRLLTFLGWLSFLSLVAGAFAFFRLTDMDNPLATLVLALVFLGPPLVVLHFVLVLRIARARYGLLLPGRGLRSLLAVRGLSLGPLLHPWYWFLLAVAVVASLAMLPFAAALAVF